jgi:hypothetical protein
MLEGSYTNLGYLPPHPASVQAFADSPTVAATFFGTSDSTSQSGAASFEKLEDLALIITVSGAQEHVRWWIEQIGSRYQVDILAGVSAAVAPYVRPYYGEAGTGQIKGMLVGLAGAARYEELSGAGFSPNARENLIMQGYGQLLFVGIVVLGGTSSLMRHLLSRNREQDAKHSAPGSGTGGTR